MRINLSLVTLDIVADIVGILTTLLVIIGTLPLIEKGKEPMTAALFVFALVSLGLSLAYWITYTTLRPDTRMPLAANEIGECAWFLLITTMLSSIFKDNKNPARKETIFAIVYFAFSVGLWIAWTGEWFQDIIFGLPYGYFLCMCVRLLKQTDALSETEWRVLGITAFAIILAQIANVYVPLLSKQPLDYFCYILMFSVLIWMYAKSISAIRQNEDSKKCIALTYSLGAFGFSTLYMSSDWFYLFALLICYSVVPLMLIALRREMLS